MKSSILKSTFAMVVASYVVMSSAYADAYLRTQEIESGQRSYVPESHLIGLNPKFSDLNKTYFGGAAHKSKHPLSLKNDYYVALPGSEKRRGVFKLEKSSDGTENGPRVPLEFDSKDEANDFCTLMGAAFFDHGKAKTVFVSDWLGGITEVIAVAYKVDYQGDLTRATKYVFCPNRWETRNEYWNSPDPKYADENETTGVRASGFVGNIERSSYRVACMNSKPETTFTSTSHTQWSGETLQLVTTWTNGRYTFTAYGTAPEEKPTLEHMNTMVGNPYCAAQ